jgi:hypothetical protein
LHGLFCVTRQLNEPLNSHIICHFVCNIISFELKDKERRGWRGGVALSRGGADTFPVVNIPKHCQLVSPINIGWRGEALGSEVGIALGSGLCRIMQKGKKVSRVTNLT